MNDLLIPEMLFDKIIYLWMATGVITFFYLLKVTAPYGRHTTDKWGPQIDNRLGWIIMEFPVLAVLLYYLINAAEKPSLPVWIMVAMFIVHYINRTFVFPLRIKTKGKKMPVIIVASAICFNLVNGFSLGYYFTHFASYSISWLTDFRFLTGVMLFITGIVINWKSDTILINLRKPGETHYSVPGGWLFEYISCPNLFGELIEWFGFALLCWNLPAVSFFVWTAANLIPRAISHHKWYKEKFPEYPSGRKAVLPNLW